MTLLLALLIIAATVVLMVRRVDVRLVLFGAGLLMATLAGRPLAVFDTFTRGMVAPMVAPICAAMGFAAVLAATGCDRHLVLLLLAPIAARPDSPALAALACLAGAFGRTMSPVAAVVIYTSGLVGVPPLPLVRRLLPALLAGAAVSLALVLVLGNRTEIHP